MIKAIVKQCLLALLADDDEIKIKLMEIANPDLAFDIKYGDRKHPPPRPCGWWKDPSRSRKSPYGI